jgi:POT family proton-dependent oligopeptide transporter
VGASTDLDEGPRIRTYRGHPVGLVTLVLTEIWERFSFYGLAAILVLYLSDTPERGGIGLDTPLAASLVLVYTSMVYLLTLPGGWVADRLTGTRLAVFIGGVIITIGHLMMMPTGTVTVFAGLALVATGTGLLKANISTLLGRLYDQLDDPGGVRRDAGFNIFYFGINAGALAAALVVSWLASRYGYHWGFAAAAVGMFAGLVQYVLGGRLLGEVGRQPNRPLPARDRARLARHALTGAAAIGGLLWLDVAAGWFSVHHVVNGLSALAVVVAVGYFATILRDREVTAVERSRVRGFAGLFVGAALFWMIVDQAPDTMTLFAEHNTDRRFFGWDFPAGFYQGLQPAFIMALAPVFAWLWLSLGRRSPNTPVKFALGLFGAGASFVVMAIAANLAADGTLVSPWWLVWVYLIQTVGELCLSPVGLSATTKLAPRKYASQMMGLWFLAVTVGDAAGAQYVELQRTLGAWQFWALLAATAVVVGAVIWANSRKLHDLMAGVD